MISQEDRSTVHKTMQEIWKDLNPSFELAFGEVPKLSMHILAENRVVQLHDDGNHLITAITYNEVLRLSKRGELVDELYRRVVAAGVFEIEEGI